MKQLKNRRHNVTSLMAQSRKTSTSGAGGMGFKYRADQISHTLQSWMCGPWHKAQMSTTAHSWHPKGY